ncbi:MAG TPA: hypothetical protein VFR67_06010 [Pilimelia sp.]|nr:hypothetical protein [Pilimelia sp.]
MSLGWAGQSVWEEPAPTEAELAAVAVLAIDLHADGGRRWCCRTDPCGHLAWARGFLADRVAAS